MMADGWQCWTHSREMDENGRMPSISRTVAWWTKFDLQGDYNFFDYSGRVGSIHSNAYTYFRNPVSTTAPIIFVGSLSEASGYTYLKANLPGGQFSLYKDIQGKVLAPKETLDLRFLVTRHASMSVMWERYGSYYGYPKAAMSDRPPRHLTGWSSWYNYYERVTEDDVRRCLAAFKEHKYPIDVFQIDDGYQTAVGDWLSVDVEKFPSGMHHLAKEISAGGYIPGVWLAPYAVGFKSQIVAEHPDWLLKDPNTGGFLVAGPNWGGFYALDIYHPEARAYLRAVFDEILDDWGYRLLKLDFIFAAAMVPRQGKSRGEILWDAVTFLGELNNGRAMLLGSGVPLPATYGRLDYSRVSSDAAPFWDHALLKLSNVRERVATQNALTSTLHRWPMKHVFGVDPDVFFLRSNDNKLTLHERFTTMTVNMLLGQLTLMSDDINLYSQEEHHLYASTFPKVQPVVENMRPVGPNVFQIDYTAHGRRYLTIVNLSPVLFKTTLPQNEAIAFYFFEHRNPLVSKESASVLWFKPEQQDPIALNPHESRTFLYVTDRFAGSTGHIIPGWDVFAWKEENEVVRVSLREGRAPSAVGKANLWVMVEEEMSPTVYIDGVQATVDLLPQDKSGIRVARCSI
ncbi:glycoside hydrolase superfamily [Dichotomocladium elegans]|nr:glycoside hydrolase superfamily [Dichotomocladium elegans]